jgi:hypothetical protein
MKNPGERICFFPSIVCLKGVINKKPLTVFPVMGTGQTNGQKQIKSRLDD